MEEECLWHVYENKCNYTRVFNLGLSVNKWSDVKCSDVGWSDVIYVKWFYFEVKWSWSETKLSELLKWSEVSYGEFLVDTGAMYIMVTLYWGNLIILWLFHLGISSTVFVFICTVVVLNCFVIVCVCVCVCVCMYVYVWAGFVMCGCLDNVHSLNLFGYPDWGFSVLFPARVWFAKTGHGQHFQICYSCCFVVNCYVLCIVCV
jgi:hypothetical protein